ncbi:MAG: FixH family protein [Janthinobacterium lividum]
MNWGTKLAIAMTVFIAFIIGLGLMMVNSKSDELVDANYYENGLKYDRDYNRKEQVLKDHAEPQISISPENLSLKFIHPSTGKIKLIRTADKKMDAVLPFKTNADNEVSVPLQNIAKGSWHLLADWQSEGKAYLFEKEILLK